jgi:hypothetical protein
VSRPQENDKNQWEILKKSASAREEKRPKQEKVLKFEFKK